MEIHRLCVLALLVLMVTSTEYQHVRQKEDRRRCGGSDDALAIFKCQLTDLLSGIKQQNTQKGAQLVSKLSDEVIDLYKLLGRVHEGHESDRLVKKIKENVKQLLATIEEIKDLYESPVNVVTGENNTVVGNCNFINGKLNCVTGNDGSVIGTKNELSGNCSTLISSNSKICGSGSFLVGKNTVINGNDNVAFANDRTLTGNNRLILGQYNIDMVALNNDKKCFMEQPKKRNSDRN